MIALGLITVLLLTGLMAYTEHRRANRRFGRPPTTIMTLSDLGVETWPADEG